MTTQLLINELIDKNLTIGSVESFTGGLFAATLVNYPGVSKINSLEENVINEDDILLAFSKLRDFKNNNF